MFSDGVTHLEKSRGKKGGGGQKGRYDYHGCYNTVCICIVTVSVFYEGSYEYVNVGLHDMQVTIYNTQVTIKACGPLFVKFFF